MEAPAGYHVYSVTKKTDEKFSFVAVRKGKYKFCFVNHSPVHETIAFDIHVGQKPVHHSEVAKDGMGQGTGSARAPSTDSLILGL